MNQLLTRAKPAQTIVMGQRKAEEGCERKEDSELSQDNESFVLSCNGLDEVHYRRFAVVLSPDVSNTAASHLNALTTNHAAIISRPAPCSLTLNCM